MKLRFAIALLLAAGCNRQTTTTPTAPPAPLRVFCAAGLKSAVENIALTYQHEGLGVVELQYGASQSLLASLEISRSGDLYIPGDDSFLEPARAKGLIAETIPLAQMSVVVVVRPGNPKNIRALADLFRDDVKFGVPNPDAAAAGKLARAALQRAGRWEQLQPRVAVFKPTVNDVAADVKLGALDAGFVFDAVARQYPGLETVTLPELQSAIAKVPVAVLRSSMQPTAALRFARYLGGADKGLRQFAALGYSVVEGDAWAEAPELLFFSGAVNRVAVDELLRRFEQREGVRITRVYNGCGILVGQMKTGERPDAYLTCDRSFASPVADLFIGEPLAISETDIVLVVPAGNPLKLRELADLARPGLRLGLANPDQSTLGALTVRMLDRAGITKAVQANVVTQTPTGDLLVNQLRTSRGSLDGVIVYRVNATKGGRDVEIVPLNAPGARAEQTFSIGTRSKHKQLAGRLRDALRTAEARQQYEAAGFRWRADATGADAPRE